MHRRTVTRRAPASSPGVPSPAEQAHICEGLVPRGGDRVELVVVVLAFSRAAWAEFQPRPADAALSEALEHAWAFFGGAPRTWLFDSRSVLPPQVLELAQRHGATARTRRAWAPEAMSLGERVLQRVPERLLASRTLRDLDQANRSLRGFVDQVLREPHPVQPDRRVRELLDEERLHLLAAGDR